MANHAVSIFVPDLTVQVAGCPHGSNAGGWFILASFDSYEAGQRVYNDIRTQKDTAFIFKGYKVSACALEPYEIARATDKNSLKLLGITSQVDIKTGMKVGA